MCVLQARDPGPQFFAGGCRRPRRSRTMDFAPVNYLCRLLCLTVLTLVVTGCNTDPNSGDNSKSAANTGIRVQGLNLNDVSAPAPQAGPINLAAAKNEWTNCVIQIDGLQGQWGK